VSLNKVHEPLTIAAGKKIQLVICIRNDCLIYSVLIRIIKLLHTIMFIFLSEYCSYCHWIWYISLQHSYPILAVPGHALLWLILVKCKRSVSSLLQVSAVQHTFGWHPVAALQHTFGWHPVAAVQHTFCWHPVATVQHTYLVDTRWQQYSTRLVDTRWQQYSTHLVDTRWQQYSTHLVDTRWQQRSVENGWTHVCIRCVEVCKKPSVFKEC
jgi:hypothetical protein